MRRPLTAGLMLGALLPLAALAAPPADYLVQSRVYQWYGALDQGKLPTSLMDSDSGADLAEYPNASPVPGAHHILAIEQLGDDKGRLTLEVEAEYQARDSAPGEGRYLVQTLVLDSNSLRLLSSDTQVNDLDDLSGEFRPVAEQHLIRALIYRWTQALDLPGSDNLEAMLAQQARFNSPEPGNLTATAYQEVLQALNNRSNRRAIKNLTIGNPGADGSYPVNLEYQWTAINSQGETELARLSVTMVIVLHDGVALIQSYQSQYLAPETDLGAEIRC